MQIGYKIKKIRDDRKFSQSEMAELLGISQSAYSRLERDEMKYPQLTGTNNYKVKLYCCRL